MCETALSRWQETASKGGKKGGKIGGKVSRRGPAPALMNMDLHISCHVRKLSEAFDQYQTPLPRGAKERELLEFAFELTRDPSSGYIQELAKRVKPLTPEVEGWFVLDLRAESVSG